MRRLSIDIETYSTVNLTKSGVYKYVEAPDFQILLLAYAYDDDEVQIVDLASGEQLIEQFKDDLFDPNITKTAFNASFEIACLNAHLKVVELDTSQWQCSMVQAMYAGLSGSLDSVSKALGLDIQKDSSGKNLIKYFSVPCKPTQINGMRTRNFPYHEEDKWDRFKSYCKQDVEVERAIKNELEKIYKVSQEEHQLWVLDQKINSTGIEVNPTLIKNAMECDEIQTMKLIERAKMLTGLANPNSKTQVRQWLSKHENIQVDSLSKENMPEVESKLKTKESKELINIIKELSKTSVKKYVAMDNCKCNDNRVRGLLQFYGASRTGRWAGRLIQVHNLPQNKMQDLGDARNFLIKGDYTALEILYPSVSNVLSQLIRTAFVPPTSYKFLISDFSAIEARVIAWLAGEKWRIDVFGSHGKIYEASASQMFKVPIEEIGKDSPLRQKGKVAELALGYQGGVGALETMGALKMGLTEDELSELVYSWRAANPKIVALWKTVERAAIKAIEQKTVIKINQNVKFIYAHNNLYIQLPSGRKLCYLNAEIGYGDKFGNKVVKFKGVDQTTKQFKTQETYGGKLVENVIQAIARDCLAMALIRLDRAGYKIVMHVHDEVILEIKDEHEHLEKINEMMSTPIEWAKGLPLKGDSFETMYYMKG